ncbi:polysaccharide biosynthesis/export family protein [Williamwhitmania taraxaci]|uniref:polysaccharide biosynthesis/export family protein n=1 Tax=Williamwhitmania taraxaci TaxID=1640674 RepID=UPI0021D1D696|nr:SLBB domain-containing protein [Williamwhitmania taraxaci]
MKLVNFKVTVLGEVNSPGSFTIDKEQINLFQALGLAGGMKNFGNGKKVTLVRQTDSGSEVIPLDLTDRNILASDYYYLMPNDMIYIEPLKAKSNIDGSNFTAIAFSSATTILLIVSILLR